MGRELEGEDARVDDTHILRSVHHEFRVNDTSLFLRQHRTGHRRVELRADLVREPILPVRVALDSRPGRRLGQQVVGDGSCLTKFTSELERLTQRNKVSVVREVHRVDGRIDERI